MGATTSPFLKTTCNRVKEFHKQYRESLGEVSLGNIRQIASDIERDTGHTKTEILFAMQQLTQFANIRSVKHISEVMLKNDISYIGNGALTLEAPKTGYKYTSGKELHDVVHDGTGLHRSLTYLLEHKGFGPLRKIGKMRTAYFLDEQKVGQLERLKEKDAEKFKHFINNPELKFFTISSWDSGINFVDRTKDLETETRKLLSYSDEMGLPVDEAIDAPLMERIRALGISPNVISKEGMPTERCVYNQMTPEKMTEAELYNVIDANAQVRAKNPVKLVQIKDDSVNYLANYFKVYTPETMSLKLKELHTSINEYAKEHGFEEKDIIYFEPHAVKSNALISYMYKRVNNLPEDRFANVREIVNKRVKLDGKLVVFVDDCTITGESLNSEISATKRVFSKKQPKLYACVCGTTAAKNTFSYKNNNELIIADIINYIPTRRRSLSSERLHGALGGPDYGNGEATCLVLPYMAPDNNTEFASNIALLHNVNYRTSNPLIPRLFRDPHKNLNDDGAYVSMRTLRHEGVKNYNRMVDTIARKSNTLIGTSPEVSELDFKTIKEQNPRKLSDYFKLSTLEELIEEFLNPNLL